MSSPQVIIFGGATNEEEAKKGLVHLKCTWKWYPTDENVFRLLAADHYDVLVSVGKQDGSFKTLLKLPLETRKKWLHFETLSDVSESSMMYCMMANVLVPNVPFVSVFTTSFKSKHRIRRPLESLLAQTYTSWEWVIIDDTDDDNDENWKQLQEFAASDYRIRAYKPQKHCGVIGSLKRDAAMLCRGTLLVEMDHDDDIDPLTFQYLREAHAKYPEAGMFFTDFAEVMEDTDANWAYGEFFGMGYGAYTKQWYQGKWRNQCHTPALNCKTIRHIVGVPNHLRVWSSKAYHEMGGHSTGLHVVDDYELILRTFLKYQMVRIPKLCYIQYRNAGGNNFTFIRNADIQRLVASVRGVYEDKIHARLLELGHVDEGIAKIERAWMNGKEQEQRVDVVYSTCETSIVMILDPSDGADAIYATTQSVLFQSEKNFEFIVIGYRHPCMEATLSSFRDERLKWWNLASAESQSRESAQSYAYKMIAIGKKVVNISAGQVWPLYFLKSLAK